jgi:hypothetical protein
VPRPLRPSFIISPDGDPQFTLENQAACEQQIPTGQSSTQPIWLSALLPARPEPFFYRQDKLYEEAIVAWSKVVLEHKLPLPPPPASLSEKFGLERVERSDSPQFKPPQRPTTSQKSDSKSPFTPAKIAPLLTSLRESVSKFWASPKLLSGDHFESFTPASQSNVTADRIALNFREFGPPFSPLDTRSLSNFRIIEQDIFKIGLSANSSLSWSSRPFPQLVQLIEQDPLDLFRIGISPKDMWNFLKANHPTLQPQQQIGNWLLGKRILPSVLHLSTTATGLVWRLPFLVFAQFCLQAPNVKTVFSALDRDERLCFMQLFVSDRSQSTQKVQQSEIDAVIALAPALDNLMRSMAADVEEAEALVLFRSSVLGARALEPFVPLLRTMVVSIVERFARYLTHANIKAIVAKALRIGPILANRFCLRFLTVAMALDSFRVVRTLSKFEWFSLFPACFTSDIAFVQTGARHLAASFLHSSAVLALKRSFAETPVEIMLTIYGREGRWTQQFVCAVIRLFRDQACQMQYCPFPRQLVALYMAPFRTGGIGLGLENAADVLREIFELVRMEGAVESSAPGQVAAVVEQAFATFAVPIARLSSVCAFRCLKSLMKLQFQTEVANSVELWALVFEGLFAGEGQELRAAAWKLLMTAVVFQRRIVEFVYATDAFEAHLVKLASRKVVLEDPVLLNGMKEVSQRKARLTREGNAAGAAKLAEFEKAIQRGPVRELNPSEVDFDFPE